MNGRYLACKLLLEIISALAFLMSCVRIVCSGWAGMVRGIVEWNFRGRDGARGRRHQRRGQGDVREIPGLPVPREYLLWGRCLGEHEWEWSFDGCSWHIARLKDNVKIHQSEKLRARNGFLSTPNVCIVVGLGERRQCPIGR